MSNELLLEIGTEEIPAAFIPKALNDMSSLIRKALTDERISYGTIRTFGTPRRLCLAVADVAERQEDQLIEKLGPAKRVSFDSEGNPTKAALGFAKGQGVDISEVGTLSTDKGEYLCIRKHISGQDSASLLPEILSRLVASLSFKKSMRWGDLDFRFARPIHWILALYGGAVVPFRIETIESGNLSRGHRFMKPEAFPVSNLSEYLEGTRDHFVMVDPGERKRIILEEARKAAAAVSGRILENGDLLETVTYLVEYPTVVCGSFDRKYLDLPGEVLTTSMMSHQKYFPVVDSAGQLLPYFITVNNTLARDPAVVKRGNEKVIRARLSDAQFFFEEDQKTPLEDRVEGLQQVVFHTLLGTSYEKVQRFRKLAAYIAERIGPSLKDRVDRASLLAKADLDTQMVGEFSELQGIMGREYALLAGEDPAVAKAIYEHYLPVTAGGNLPETHEGAIVSIADKMDTIAGFFGVRLVPTGTADPYALRRQALGIINIILEKRYPLMLEDLVSTSLAILDGKMTRPAEETAKDVLEFFRGRLENMLISQGHPQDVVSAVLAAGFSDLVQVIQKIEAMETFKTHPAYEPLAIAFKRAGNILKEFGNGRIEPSLFNLEEEILLHSTFIETRDKVLQALQKEDYPAALLELAALREPIDRFFGSVMVMVEEEAIRFNRLSLLEALFSLFRRIADFSKIVTAS
ncbi:MAG: Glycine--tRNA ligase beta subunit [Syntrophus sp. PtaU1.Bin005]|jgi:glycyl-tRNA synthetase beta chain|nr:MAG: Glycine--tRNA ligase beta subunit [Syntrophus sp. PtaU1.Bin005]